MKILIFCLLLFASEINCANILAIFPLKLKSHFAMFNRIVEGLAEEGHQVDVFSCFSSQNVHKNINDINLGPFCTDEITPPFTVEELRKLPNKKCMDLMFFDAGSCRMMSNSTVFQNLRDTQKKYDILIAEMFSGECYFAFAHHFGIPSVAVTSSVDLPWGGNRIGNSHNPAYVPHYFSNYLPAMNLIQRFINTITLMEYRLRHMWYLTEQNQITKNFFGARTPELITILSNTSLVLTNSHYSINGAISTLPNFKEVGGIHIKSPKPLENTIKSWIRNESFVYFSMGSIASSELFPTKQLQLILDVFHELNLKLIWKGSRDKFPSDIVIPDNVQVLPWVPQLDILCDPNILFFVTHSGLLSTQEAIYCGVPILSFPLFADQYLNAKNIVGRKIGIEISLLDTDKNNLRKIIKELIDNRIYKETAIHYSRKFRDRQTTPLEDAIFWIQYVIRNQGAPELKSEARNLSWYQYYLLDVFFMLVLFIITIILGIAFVIRYVLNNITRIKSKIE